MNQQEPREGWTYRASMGRVSLWNWTGPGDPPTADGQLCLWAVEDQESGVFEPVPYDPFESELDRSLETLLGFSRD
jgi:hypothetical protein